MRRRQYLVTIGAAAALAGCGTSDDVEQEYENGDGDGASNPTAEPAGTPKPTPTREPTPAGIDGLITESEFLRPVSVRAYAEDYTEGVRGAVENISDRRLSYVEVAMYFYQGETRVSDSLDNTTELNPGVTWRFDAPYVGDAEWDKFVGIANHRP